MAEGKSTRTILIVGGRGAIGSSLSEHFKSLGCEVIVTSSTKSSEYEYLDLTDKNSIEEFASKGRQYAHIIFAAGKEPQQSLKELEWKHFNEMLDIHFKGPLWLVKQLLSLMADDSVITFISSVAAFKGSYDPTYSSVKGAVNSLVRTLARELAPKTRVNGIAPGLVKDSPVYKRMTPDFRERHKSQTLTDKILTPKDLVDVVNLLDTNASIDGQIIHINGGQFFG